MDSQPTLAPELVHLVAELLKMPPEELRPFKAWIESLHNTHLILLVNLLQLESQVLIEVKRRLCGGGGGALPLQHDAILSAPYARATNLQ